MDIQRLCTLYYSATGNTERVCGWLAEELAASLDCPLVRIPFRTPRDRAADLNFGPGDLVVAGTPTYAGKMPNKLLPDFRARLHGGGALAAALVTFGNRSFDNALAELCATLEQNGFHTVAAGALACRHAFTDALGTNRPDAEDRRALSDFAVQLARMVKALPAPPFPVAVSGDPSAPYYVPLGTDGRPAVFLKAKPRTDAARCTNCGACARLCPMGAIDPQDVFSVPGTCIKCQSCVRKCTRHAKYFDDPAFLSHVAMLERDYREPKLNQFFFSE